MKSKFKQDATGGKMIEEKLDMFPKIDFNNLVEQKNDQDTTEFPNTFNHTEDVIFLRPREESDGTIIYEAISLDCIFY